MPKVLHPAHFFSLFRDDFAGSPTAVRSAATPNSRPLSAADGVGEGCDASLVAGQELALQVLQGDAHLLVEHQQVVEQVGGLLHVFLAMA